MQVIAYGFIATDNIEYVLRSSDSLKEYCLGVQAPPSYLLDPWNYLDITVLVTSYVNMFSQAEGLGVLRLLRAFRPLRMVNRVEGMKLVLLSLYRAIPSLGNVIVLMLGAFLIFGITGVSLFMGRMHSCNDVVDEYVGGSNQSSCYGTTNIGGFWAPKHWSNPDGSYSFDNIFIAILTLFQVKHRCMVPCRKPSE